MAERRMFAKTIIDSDAFLDMPLSTQALYFHLSMRADDEGFINNPKKISRMIGCSDDDLKLLLAKKFILAFDSGIIVIKHWRIHNYIQKDRFKETVYKEERESIELKENGAYTFCIQDGYMMDTQVRLGKDRLDKVSIENTPAPKKYGAFENVILSDDELEKLKQRFPDDYAERIETLSEGIKSKGYKYKSHYATILSWARKDEQRQKERPTSPYKIVGQAKSVPDKEYAQKFLRGEV